MTEAKDYSKMTEKELSREYIDRYKVKWPEKPDGIVVDEELYNAITEKACCGK